MRAAPAEPWTHFASVVVPVAAAVAAGVRYQVAAGVSVGLLCAIALAPVWLGSIAKFRGAWPILLLGAAATTAGVILTVLDPFRERPPGLLFQWSLVLASLIGLAGLLLWVRDCVGSAVMVAAYGFGLLLSELVIGINLANPWKSSFSVPVALILLGLAGRAARPWVVEAAALAVMSIVALGADSRSLTAMLLLTLVVVVMQVARQRVGGTRARPWSIALMLGAVGLAVFQMLQALVLEGVLGEAAQQRSQAQIETSGSILAGGRPEAGAAFALITRQPWGYGNGVLPTTEDVWVAKAGMAGLNYDPNNGYVERYMFGGGYEVHSVLGDLWLRAGPLGAAFVIAVLVYCLYSMVSAFATGRASAILIFLTLQLTWNTFFSPILSSSRTFAVTLALAAPLAVTQLARPRPELLPSPALDPPAPTGLGRRRLAS